MERVFISLSHLQHSDTAAVKDSLPQTPAQEEMTLKSRNKRATTKPLIISVPPKWMQFETIVCYI